MDVELGGINKKLRQLGYRLDDELRRSHTCIQVWLNEQSRTQVFLQWSNLLG